MQRHPGAGRFVWSSAVEDDVPVPRDLRVTGIDLFRGEAKCSGYLHRIFVERELVAQINDDNWLPAIDLFLQFFWRNARDAKPADKASPLDGFEPKDNPL